jgi:hypothetical protein
VRPQKRQTKSDLKIGSSSWNRHKQHSMCHSNFQTVLLFLDVKGLRLHYLSP